MTVLHTYLIEPKAPLVIRSGRPFDEQSGADPARFPPPSTLAGALRTAHAESCGKPFGPELAQLAVAGPLPVCLASQRLLVPKPADALYFSMPDKSAVVLERAAPGRLAEGECCDLPAGLQPVRLVNNVKGKPAPGPRWWSFSDLLAWRDFSQPPPSPAQIRENGWMPPADEIRTHVGIAPASQAAASGKLFQTAGLHFWHRIAVSDGVPINPVGLIGQIAGEITPGLITLGGERRLSAITPAPASLWPAMPDDLCARIRAAGGLSLTLLTPALFARGWQPPEYPGLKLAAAALERWQPHSGWDLAQRKPRAGRKLVPAGAVYWYTLTTDIGDEALAALWMTPLSDDKQDRRDGFGMVLPQPWTPLP
ncbi:type III-B CRISPR module-associated Cmr3 family protein [Azonexus sp.]|uniref:type III-B CRISPR module-associated Cmr3 family protein n=1 Tax=Azonexus sp. TaxID=1872668 RepID=UPI0035B1BFB7